MVKQIMANKSLILLMSYHHKNTEKITKVIADVLDAQIKSPQQINPDEIDQYDLISIIGCCA
ncbi:MAG: hypothetical protein KBA53_04110 [Thermoclostridium sp.]|nr:hypothetical protein [Thermoclostridium sp.]